MNDQPIGIDDVDLTNCDREPIHIPGAIQPHGCLLVTDVGFERIIRHSANAADMLEIGVTELNGRDLRSVMPSKAVHALRNVLATSTEPTRAGLILGFPLTEGGPLFDVAVHHHRGSVIVEFERSPAANAVAPLEVARLLIARLRELGEMEDLLDHSARLIQRLLGYDRVMIYRFAYDGSGQVVSEAKREDLEPFYGLHFPATDIPQQARRLYLQNTIRVISDADCPRVPIEPAFDASGEPLDLSFAHLRSVSPIHCEYLRNMGVDASMSISIVIGGELWGLVACHHYSKRSLSMAERIAAEMFGEFFSLHLETVGQRQKLGSARRARQTLDRILRDASKQIDLADLIRRSATDIAELMPCDGVGTWIDGTWSGHGAVPPPGALPALTRFLASVSDGGIWATHALSQHLASAGEYAAEASGLMAVPLSQLPRDYLLFFRREEVQTVEWAGDPQKQYETGRHGDRLTPRKSFAIWRETVEGQSVPWSQEDRDIAEAARSALVEIILRHSELLGEERSRADLRQRMLNEELNHRVKNILALIKSLVSHPAGPSIELGDFVRALQGRIQALAFAHDQVIRSDGGGDLRDLLEAELSPYRGTAAGIVLDGPTIGLDSRAYSVMALVLHELATNAAKYGALSVETGRLQVTWRCDREGACEIFWEESGGPSVEPPSRNGFGSVLINRSIPFDLGGESELRYPPDGVKARFQLPERFITFVEETAPARASEQRAGAGDRDQRVLDGLPVLLVEDQLLIAMDMEATLAEMGAAQVETCASAAAALSCLVSFRPAVAILDVNLGAETSLAVAEELVTRGIPFIFATGYADSTMIPKGLSFVPVVRKPYDAETLAVGLRKVLGDGGEGG